MFVKIKISLSLSDCLSLSPFPPLALSLSPALSLSLSRQWLVRSKAVSERQEACWDLVTQMKGDVLALLDSENDGVRTHAIKFTESLIVTLSPRTSDSDVPKRQENDISLDKVPKDHLYIRYGGEFFVVVVVLVGHHLPAFEKQKCFHLLRETVPFV